jgi:hypothetical protein
MPSQSKSGLFHFCRPFTRTEFAPVVVVDYLLESKKQQQTIAEKSYHYATVKELSRISQKMRHCDTANANHARIFTL